jgi:hypothetical protein
VSPHPVTKLLGIFAAQKKTRSFREENHPRRRLVLRCCGLVACAVTHVAQAEAPPALRPVRDVDVTYKVPVPGGTGANLLQRLRWSATLQRQRVDLPTSGNWMVLDFIRNRMALVRDESHEVIDLPAPRSAAQPGAGAGYSRLGPQNVAGLPCIEWRTVDTRGEESIACYTDDGVLLRARQGSRVLMEAVNVKYAAQDANVFEPPANFTHQQTSR